MGKTAQSNLCMASLPLLYDARKNGADWKYILHLPLDCLRRVGFDFSPLSEFRDRLIEDELLQKPIIVINLGLKKFAESPEEPEVKVVQWIGSRPQVGIRR